MSVRFPNFPSLSISMLGVCRWIWTTLSRRYIFIRFHFTTFIKAYSVHEVEQIAITDNRSNIWKQRNFSTFTRLTRLMRMNRFHRRMFFLLFFSLRLSSSFVFLFKFKVKICRKKLIGICIEVWMRHATHYVSFFIVMRVISESTARFIVVVDHMDSWQWANLEWRNKRHI